MDETNHQDDTMIEEEDSGYYEHGRNYELLNTEILQRLKGNDPAITSLHIPLDCGTTIIFPGEDRHCFFNSIDWKKDGDCIANNTQLKTIKIFCQRHISRYMPLTESGQWHIGGRSYILGEQGDEFPTKQQLQDFFSCVYQNRSIKNLSIISISIIDEFGGGLIEGLQGHYSLTRLEIGYDIEIAKLGSIVCSALGKVLKHPQSKKKVLNLRNCILDDDGYKLLSDGLLGNSRMKRLELGGNEGITPVGWQALSTVLQHPNCKLVHLELYDTEINDESAVMLGNSLVGGSSVRALSLSDNRSISRECWQTLLNQLAQTSIENLDLSNNMIDEPLVLANMCGTIKSLDLSSNELITSEGWRSFFSSLQTRGAQLVKLGISYNNIGNEGEAALGRLLSNMSTLKTLDMNNMEGISSQGWRTFFTSIQDSNMNLVKLDFSDNDIDDEGIQLLTRLVSRMSTLKTLNLKENQSVTPTGWQALSGYFQNINFALESLDLSDNNIEDDAVIAFTSALTNNKTLKLLDLHQDREDFEDDEGDNELITERGWEAMSHLICNKTSIIDTYNSNHTLQGFGHLQNPNMPDDSSVLDRLLSDLDLNENEDKVEVARQKILQTHFSTEDSPKMQEFLDMKLEVMPTAIAWIGRPLSIDWTGEKVSGLSTMFNLMRRLPDLFDSTTQKKTGGTKRKRGV